MMMLKRQRQQSPPPSRSDIPLVADSVDALPASREFKRRRMAPPVLDGMSRGWDLVYGDDEEEYDISEDDNGAADAPQQRTMGEYSATNNLLRELHTLNQHRLLFLPSPTKHMPPLASRNSARAQPNNEEPPVTSKALPPPLDRTALRQDFPLPREDNGVSDEMTHVLKRYEGTNRLLGDLFLSRRRETGPSIHPSI